MFFLLEYDLVTWWVLFARNSELHGFELTNFHVWFRPALSYLWDIEYFCRKKIDRLRSTGLHVCTSINSDNLFCKSYTTTRPRSCIRIAGDGGQMRKMQWYEQYTLYTVWIIDLQWYTDSLVSLDFGVVLCALVSVMLRRMGLARGNLQGILQFFSNPYLRVSVVYKRPMDECQLLNHATIVWQFVWTRTR